MDEGRDLSPQGEALAFWFMEICHYLLCRCADSGKVEL